MDPNATLIKHLIDDYGLTPEQAQVYAQKVMSGSDNHEDNVIKAEAAAKAVQPYIAQANRIKYFNELEERSMHGDKLSPEEQDYYTKVKGMQKSRVASQAQAMLAAQKLAGLVQPSPASQVDIGQAQLEPVPQLSIGQAQVLPVPSSSPLAIGQATVAPDTSQLSHLASMYYGRQDPRLAGGYWNKPENAAKRQEQDAAYLKALADMKAQYPKAADEADRGARHNATDAHTAYRRTFGFKDKK